MFRKIGCWYKLNEIVVFLPKLFGPTVRKNCSSNREKLLKFEAEGREFAKILDLLKSEIIKHATTMTNWQLAWLLSNLFSI